MFVLPVAASVIDAATWPLIDTTTWSAQSEFSRPSDRPSMSLRSVACFLSSSTVVDVYAMRIAFIVRQRLTEISSIEWWQVRSHENDAKR